MSETIFVQFMVKLRTRGVDHYTLANGFSDTYSLCKSKGDFVWIEHAGDLTYERGQLIEEFMGDTTFPIKKGTAYISALHIFNLYQSYIWARENPDVKFIVGGPAIDKGAVIYRLEDIPKNLEITTDSVEEHFGVPPFSQEWGIDLPTGLDDGYSLFITYPLDNDCYWGKCIYCRYQNQQCVPRIRKDLNYEFLDIESDRDKIIWLQTNALTPQRIKTVLPSLTYRDDIFYSSFIRGSKAEADALEETLSKIDPTKIKLCMGIEFPSNRMLKFMDKGVTKEEMLQTLNVADKYGMPMTVYFIVGWPDLIEEDIAEVEDFVSQMPRNNINDQKIFYISPSTGTQLYNLYKDREKMLTMSSGPFHCSYCVELNEEQQALNDRAKELIVGDGYFTVDRSGIENVGAPIEHKWRN